MPYYRISIWLKEEKKPVQGIRHYENSNIDAVTNMARLKAQQHYGERNVSDVEAAMLSNHCRAVKQLLKKMEKERQDKKFQTGAIVFTGSFRRKYDPDAKPLGERNK